MQIVTVQAMLKTIRLLCITVSAGRSRSVKNAADTKLFAAPGLAKSKYRRFSRPASTAMHKRRSKNQVGLNCNCKSFAWKIFLIFLFHFRNKVI